MDVSIAAHLRSLSKHFGVCLNESDLNLSYADETQFHMNVENRGTLGFTERPEVR